jgi:dolichol-phosphate mannosyltransferase
MDSAARPELSVVIPVLNESRNVAPLLDRLAPILSGLSTNFEIIYVDDGSTDDTAASISTLAVRQPVVRLVQLARNFGHQAALCAGLAAARGDAVITMDGDLQHPPELIPVLVMEWRGGAEVVQTIRREPADGNPVKRAASRGFYRLLSRISRVRVTPGAADFRLMSREAVAAFLACAERCRFNRGLVQWIGFDCVEVPYDAAPRHTGRSKYSWRAMFRLAADAVFSFSTWPLRLAGLAGVIVSAGAAVYLLYALWAALFTDWTVPGWTSLLGTMLVLGGVQLITLWILGEYVGRLYEEVKQRPLYVVRATPRLRRR